MSQKNNGKTKWGIVSMAVLCAMAIAPTAFAADDIVKAQIPFAFHVGAGTLDAGVYDFHIDWEAQTVTVSGARIGSATATELFVTTLGPAQHSTGTDAHVVFDKLGSTYTLSEVWEPGFDGVLVYATKGKHEHEVVHVKR